MISFSCSTNIDKNIASIGSSIGAILNLVERRVLGSVLARHYSDFSSEALKEVYEKAGIRILA